MTIASLDDLLAPRRPAAEFLVANLHPDADSSSHFDSERGCVVPTSRSIPEQYLSFSRIDALRLVLRTQPRSAK